MIREIKFRAWDKKNKIMRTVWSIDWSFNRSEIQSISLNDVIDEQNTLWNDNFELMEFTGLLDKNGKEIYEGDIIKITYGTFNFKGKKEVITDVYFAQQAFRYRHDDGSGSVLYFNSVEIIKGYEAITQDVELIGNIYEHKNLLDAN